MTADDRTTQAVTGFFAAAGRADREAWLALFTPDVHFEDPVGGPVLVGHEGVARFHKGLSRAWQSLTMTPTAVHTRGDRAAAAWEARGRSTSGQDIEFGGVDLFQVNEEGLISRVEAFWDFEGVIARM